MLRGRIKLDVPARDDPARGLHVLKNKALVAVANARTANELYAIQLDIVEGAARLVGYLDTQPRTLARDAALAAARAYHQDAEAALARMRRLPADERARRYLP